MANNIKSSLIRSFKNKRLHMFGVFVVLAFIFLVLTKFSKDYTENITLKVEYVNLPEDVTITLKKPAKLDVEVSAVGFRILAYYFKDRTIVLDLENEVEKRDSVYIWEPMITDKLIKDKIGYAVKILSVRPDSLIIPFAILDSKIIPIRLNSKVTLGPGYDYVDSLKIVPDSIRIIGPNNILKSISHVETEIFKKENAINNMSESIMLKKLDNAQIKMSVQKTQVFLDINKFTEGTLQVPVTIINLPPKIKINYFPKSVPVSFYVNLKYFNDVKAEDFLVECDYNEVKDTKKSFFSPHLIKSPEFVRTAKLKLDKVEFILTK